MAISTQEEKTVNRAGTSVSNAANTAKDMAGKAADEVKGAVSSVGQAASDAAHYMGRRAESAASAVQEGVKSTIQGGSRYLQEHDMGDMAEDLTSLIRRNPIPAVLIGVGMGFLFARAIRG